MHYKTNDECIRQYIRKRLLNTTNVLNNYKKQVPFKELVDIQTGKYHSQVSEFFQLMLNRRILGAYRYGTIKDSFEKNINPGDQLSKNMIEKIKMYLETGNLELLVDVANYCLLEFIHGKHPKRHFESADDSHHVIWE